MLHSEFPFCLRLVLKNTPVITRGYTLCKWYSLPMIQSDFLSDIYIFVLYLIWFFNKSSCGPRRPGGGVLGRSHPRPGNNWRLQSDLWHCVHQHWQCLQRHNWRLHLSTDWHLHIPGRFDLPLALKCLSQWTVPQLTIMIIYDSTWSMLIHWISVKLTGANMT